MIKLLKTKNEIGFSLFNLIFIKLGKEKGVLINTFNIYIKVYKFIFSIYLGKERRNAEKTRQKIKKSSNTYASA